MLFNTSCIFTGSKKKIYFKKRNILRIDQNEPPLIGTPLTVTNKACEGAALNARMYARQAFLCVFMRF